MPIPPDLRPFWSAAQAANPALDAARFYEAFAFGDSERMADELADLVLAGTKRATASLAWTYEVEDKRRPEPGDLSIVTSGSGTPLCIIETTAVDVMPFDDVTAEFAAAEGEDDGTLASWRREHAAYFARECARIGREPHPRMEVLCERFRVVYREVERAQQQQWGSMRTHRLVVITGGSCTGKSTLARTLQSRWLPAQWLHFSPDTILHGLPQAVVDATNLRNDWSAIDRSLLRRSTYGCLRALLEAGHAVLFDCVISTEQAARDLVAGLQAHEPYVVRLTCAWDELRRRTLARGDRTLAEVEHGFKASGSHLLFVHREVDTTGRSPDDVADEVMAAMSHPVPSPVWADNRARYASTP